MNEETNKLLFQINHSLKAIVKALVLIFWLLLGAATYWLVKTEHFTREHWWLIPFAVLVWLLAVLVFFVCDGRKMSQKIID